MQTNFTPEQFADPGTARANQILRSCVHCGFCDLPDPWCWATNWTPAGGSYLIKDMLENGKAPTPRPCSISTAACPVPVMTTCPSGCITPIWSITRAAISKKPIAARGTTGCAGCWRIPPIIPAALAGRSWGPLPPAARCAVRAMLADGAKATSRPPVAERRASGLPASGPRRKRVALLIGCAQRALNTDINDATIRLLRHGCEVVIPRDLAAAGADPSHGPRGRKAMPWPPPISAP